MNVTTAGLFGHNYIQRPMINNRFNVLYTLLVAVADYLPQIHNRSTKTFLFFLCGGVDYI
jgi:hypothetical protein